MMRNTLARAATLILAISFAPAPHRAAAQTVIIDAGAGAVFDAVLDGFPLPPPGFPPDGTGDFGGNALAVSLQAGITEQRGIGEFPLAGLDGAAPEQIQNATLTFNIDDVIGTFGPGTAFAGEASEEIQMHLYAGDGQVALVDFAAVDGAPYVVDTRPHGTITDSSLMASGPIVLEVDVTDAVRALLAAAPVAIGVVWRTIDSPTSTSIDNLGLGSAEPPGVSGSLLPYLTVELAASASPTPTPTATDEPEATATDTPTPDLPASTEPATATATAESTATADTPPDPTPTATTAPPSCAGDCDGNDAVSVNELITGVNVALGNPGGRCEAMDANRDGGIGVAELVQAVNALLNGC